MSLTKVKASIEPYRCSPIFGGGRAAQKQVPAANLRLASVAVAEDHFSVARFLEPSLDFPVSNQNTDGRDSMDERRPWTPDDISKLRSMAKKYPTTQIARELKRGHSAPVEGSST